MLKLPLPPGYFRCPTLTLAKEDAYRRQAVDTAMDVVHLAQMDKTPATGWSVLHNQEDLKIFRGPDVGTSCLCVASMEVVGSLNEAASLFLNDTTEQVKEFVERIGRDFLDSALLYSLVEPTVTRPLDRTIIQWSALVPPFKSVVLNRDYVLLECRREFTQPASGTRGWVRAMRSIELDCCPDLKASHGLQRAYTLGSGHVFWESTTRPGYLHAAYVMQASFGGNVNGKLSNFLKDMAMKRRCRSLLDIDRFLRENRLSATPFVSVDQLDPKDSAPKCFQCFKPFGLLHFAKTHCVKCGHVFCRRCIQLWNVKSHGIRAKIWACTHCGIGDARSQAAAASSSSSSQGSSICSMSQSLRETTGSAKSVSSGTSILSIDMSGLTCDEISHHVRDTRDRLVAGAASKADRGPGVILY
ncbi:Aste57867_907 [Aphanomyces stellatus]|uniref:Aste57867_907 protein n=1 Tax=Aphanomyces stellatus TaxID=120398 RepID=A0A485K7X8_9STRA|nr:hypothetical protein As57867_000906 [Aphanomyces stellatus]VFT78131.1 Aste57867_907 [Aphanomyces stellatus]